MQLTVFGATGGIGTEVVRQALAAGHRVTAVLRGDPGRLAVPAADGLNVVVADVINPAAITPPLEGADAAVSALGPRRGDSKSICADGVRAVLAAMTKTGTGRIVAVSASGLFREPGEPPLTRYVAKPLLQSILRDGKADVRHMEDELVASTAAWTIMRPSMLVNGPRGSYRTALDRFVSARTRRADVADAILAALGDPATIGHRVNVGC
ncbi:MAG: NAD(P)-dependent oxidoreductase [Trebonia sp.]